MTSIQPIEPSTTLIPETNKTKTLTVGVIVAVLVIVAPMIIGAAGGNYWVRVLDFAMLYVMLALGLNVVVGFAGLLDLGYIGNLTGGVFGSNYQDVFAFIVLIVVLVFRPSGLLGERVADRA